MLEGHSESGCNGGGNVADATDAGSAWATTAWGPLVQHPRLLRQPRYYAEQDGLQEAALRPAGGGIPW